MPPRGVQTPLLPLLRATCSRSYHQGDLGARAWRTVSGPLTCNQD